jgi:hypothetical protein
MFFKNEKHMKLPSSQAAESLFCEWLDIPVTPEANYILLPFTIGE